MTSSFDALLGWSLIAFGLLFLFQTIRPEVAALGVFLCLLGGLALYFAPRRTP
jgi:hypothetical protein